MRQSAVVALLSVAGIAACSGDNKPPPLRQISLSYSYEVAPDVSPPRAREPIAYKINIIDRKTRQPIERSALEHSNLHWASSARCKREHQHPHQEPNRREDHSIAKKQPKIHTADAGY